MKDLTPLQAKVLRDARELLCALKPGDAFPPERELAERGGVGRSVVRGMLAVLQRHRVVERGTRGWVLLRRIAPSDLPPGEEEPTSKRQRAKDFLLAELSSGRLRPGDQISELALAKTLGVATVSMREALLEMMPLGLLTKKERHKWEVATFSDERIREMREFREMVELFSLRKLLAEGLSQEQRRAFENNREETGLLVRQRRPAMQKMLRVDLGFHRLLLESTGNSLLKERAGFVYLIIEFELVSPFVTVGKGKFGLEQHLQIIDALLRGDRAASERGLIDHLRSAEQTFCSIVRQFRK